MTPHLLLILALTANLPATTPSPAAPQDPEPPTLSLALGGGGARGLAHIGVLQWLDDHRIPVHAIAGTSMGGLIGGAFASGLSADEIESAIDGTDFARFFDWNALYEPLSYRDKANARAFPGPIDTGLFGGVPLGLHPGHGVELFFSRMVFPVSDVDDFDRLPTPYRAVAVDFIDAEVVVLAEGSLVHAMRATMSLPGFFDPVEHNGELLIDGGTMRALPADVARAFGADEVLAVDVSPGLDDVDELGGFADVFVNSLTAQVRVNIEAALEESDRFVRPEVDDFEPGDFDRAARLIEIGYAAMDTSGMDLSHLALSEAEYAAWKAARKARRPSMDGFAPAFVDVEGAVATDRAFAARRLQRFVHRPLDLDDLEDALNRLKGSGRFVALRYELAARDGVRGLRIVTRENPKPGALEAGLEVRATDVDDVDLGLRARFTLRDALVRGGEWQSDLLIGPTLDLRSELYVPLAGPLFASLAGGYQQREREVYADGGRVGSYERHLLHGGADLGLGHLWLHHEVRVGVVGRRVWRDQAVGLRDLPDTDALTARARWSFDFTDHATLPRHGVRGSVVARHGFHRSETDASVDQAVGLVAGWIPIGEHALVARLEAGATFDRRAPFGDRFALGGPFRLSAFPVERFVGSNFEYASLGWQHRLGSPNNFVTAALLVAYETGAVRGFDASGVFEHVGSVNLLVDTPLGNVMAGVAVGDGEVRGYLTLGVVAY